MNFIIDIYLSKNMQKSDILLKAKQKFFHLKEFKGKKI